MHPGLHGGERAWFVTAALLLFCLASYIFLVVGAATSDDALQLTSGSRFEFGPWQHHWRMLLNEHRPCDEHQKKLAAKRQLQAIADKGWNVRPERLPTLRGDWWVLGHVKDFPVVYRPCEGTYMAFPSEPARVRVEEPQFGQQDGNP